MKKTKFSTLQLNKKAIAKLNDAQLISVKGGKNTSLEGDCTNGGITCNTVGATIIIPEKVS